MTSRARKRQAAVKAKADALSSPPAPQQHSPQQLQQLQQQLSQQQPQQLPQQQPQQRQPGSLMPVIRRITSNVIAKVANTEVSRDLRVHVENSSGVQVLVGPAKAYRLYGGDRLRDWTLPCTNGVDTLVLGDSQLKKVQTMSFILSNFYFRHAVCIDNIEVQ